MQVGKTLQGRKNECRHQPGQPPARLEVLRRNRHNYVAAKMCERNVGRIDTLQNQSVFVANMVARVVESVVAVTALVDVGVASKRRSPSTKTRLRGSCP